MLQKKFLGLKTRPRVWRKPLSSYSKMSLKFHSSRGPESFAMQKVCLDRGVDGSGLLRPRLLMRQASPEQARLPVQEMRAELLLWRKWTLLEARTPVLIAATLIVTTAFALTLIEKVSIPPVWIDLAQGKLAQFSTPQAWGFVAELARKTRHWVWPVRWRATKAYSQELNAATTSAGRNPGQTMWAVCPLPAPAFFLPLRQPQPRWRSATSLGRSSKCQSVRRCLS